MNQLFQRNRVKKSNDFGLIDFMKSTTPQQAKTQVENLISSGKMSNSEFEQLKNRAMEIAKSLNI